MSNPPVSRHEFEAAMTRIESLLDKQTSILVKLAATEADNKHRDAKITAAADEARRALDAATHLKLVAARAAGAASAVAVGIQVALKNLGIL